MLYDEELRITLSVYDTVCLRREHYTSLYCLWNYETSTESFAHKQMIYETTFDDRK